jgi:transcriptional regulator with XRE-family HTH domain
MNDMAARLRELREQKNYSQEAMAAAAGVSQVSWSTWEKEPPKQFAALRNLVEQFGITADWFLGIVPESLPPGRVDLPPDILAAARVLASMSRAKREEAITVLAAMASHDWANMDDLRDLDVEQLRRDVELLIEIQRGHDPLSNIRSATQAAAKEEVQD